MKKKSIRGVIAYLLSLVMVVSLLVGLDTTVRAEGEQESIPSNNDELIVEYEQVSTEEFDELIEEARVAEENAAVQDCYKGTDSFWSQFSQAYYNYSFSKLNANQRDAYYALYNKFYTMIDGGENCTDYDNNYGCYLTPVTYYSSTLSDAEILYVGYLLMFNRPELYYLNSVIYVVEDNAGRRGIRIGVYNGLQTSAQRQEAASAMKSKISWYLNQVSASASAYDKEVQIHNLLYDNCYYGGANTRYSQSCASVFLNSGGETVCAGYSEAFALLCYACGIPVVSVTSAHHQWNMVQIGNYWYAVDLTGDDTSGSRYKFFNKSDATMIGLDSANHSIEGFWSSVGRPSCPYDYGSEHHGDVSSGICIGNHSYNNVSAGLAIYGANYNQLEYQWLGYDLSTGKWFAISDWQLGSNWVSWNPGKSGSFWLLGKARWADTKAEATSSCIGIQHKQCINATCQMPNPYWGGGWLIGISTFDNPNNSYRYELCVLDCNRYIHGDPNPWIYSTGPMNTGGGNTAWTVWQPQHGYYWTLFRIYDAYGNLLDQDCFGAVA